MGHYNNARGLSLFKAHFQRIHKANKWHPLYLKFCLRSFWGSSLWMSFNPIFQNIFIKFRIMFLKVRTTKKLVGGCNPSEKYARQNGFIFPNFRGENKNFFWVATTQKKKVAPTYYFFNSLDQSPNKSKPDMLSSRIRRKIKKQFMPLIIFMFRQPAISYLQKKLSKTKPFSQSKCINIINRSNIFQVLWHHENVQRNAPPPIPPFVHCFYMFATIFVSLNKF